jgi:hypothetical protein
LKLSSAFSNSNNRLSTESKKKKKIFNWIKFKLNF